jgi:exosortase
LVRLDYVFNRMTSVSTTSSTFSPPDVPHSETSEARSRIDVWAPVVVGAIAFAVLFAQPFVLLVRDWWEKPEAGHGLLLAPVALWLAWRSGIRAGASGNIALGLGILAVAVVIRYASGLAAELFTMRGSMILAVMGLVTYAWGFRQVLHWWLPFVLVGLSVPLPEIVTQALALPLQFKASQMGAALLEMRHVPVRLTGNVIRLPGQELFVTEACSGLRSLTAIISMAVLFGALMLRTVVGRAVLVGAAILVAVLVNGVRVFLTGFLVFYVSPALGAGFMHTTEGWLLFLVSLACLAALTWLGMRGERLFRRLRHADA